MNKTEKVFLLIEHLFYRMKINKNQNKYIMCSIVIIAIKKNKKKKCNSNREWQNVMLGEDFSAKGKLITQGRKPGRQRGGYSRWRRQCMVAGGGTTPCVLEEKQAGQGGWTEQWREMRSEQKDIRSCRIWMPMWELWILSCMTWEAGGLLIQRRYKLA